jgi:hypothetical protein
MAGNTLRPVFAALDTRRRRRDAKKPRAETSSQDRQQDFPYQFIESKQEAQKIHEATNQVSKKARKKNTRQVREHDNLLTMH